MGESLSILIAKATMILHISSEVGCTVHKKMTYFNCFKRPRNGARKET